MEITVNNLKYIKHETFHVGGECLVIVFAETEIKEVKKYAGFVDDENSKEEIEMIMKNGFKPQTLQNFLNDVLEN